MLYRRKVLIRLIAGGLLLASGHKVSAEAANFSYTALITSQGKVLAQSPAWISYVNHAPRAGYFSDYKVVLKEGVFEGSPGFCAVSVVDADTLDDVFYAQAKLSGTPTRHSVKVITHQIGSADPQANASKSFMLMCAK